MPIILLLYNFILLYHSLILGVECDCTARPGLCIYVIPGSVDKLYC